MKSRPVKKAISWKRVLRGVPATGAAKRRQRVKGPCDRASKGISRGSRDVLKRRRQHRGAKNGNGRNEAPAKGESRRHSNSPDLLPWPSAEVPPGSKSTAPARGSARNLGGPDVSTARAVVPPSRATSRAERDGRRGVGAPHSTDEAGTAARATLRREGGAGSPNRSKERRKGCRALKLSQRNSNG